MKKIFKIIKNVEFWIFGNGSVSSEWVYYNMKKGEKEKREKFHLYFMSIEKLNKFIEDNVSHSEYVCNVKVNKKLNELSLKVLSLKPR